MNALAHRDYEDREPARVTVFVDRIELLSPGGLPSGVDAQEFRSGKASPRWRHRSLAFYFNRLQLAQAEGQGIPTILRSMRSGGSPEPLFLIGERSVTCVLPAHPRHALRSAGAPRPSSAYTSTRPSAICVRRYSSPSTTMIASGSRRASASSRRCGEGAEPEDACRARPAPGCVRVGGHA